MKSNPQISIITVCYNSEKTIKDTIESVLNQTFNDFEHIIVDGKSSDSTLKIINSYASKYKGKLIVISEKDKGLYDAMNKGIKLARGNIIGILNSDDILANDKVLEKISNAFSNNEIDGVYGDLEFRDSIQMKKTIRKWKSKTGNYLLGWHPPHTTLYLKKEIYNKYGNYNINYKICADYDFMLRIMKQNIILDYISDNLVYMRSGGVSTNGIKGYAKNFKESYKVLKDNNMKCPLIISIIRVIKTILQML